MANDVVGTSSNDTLIGTVGDDLITGFGGNDVIDGLDGSDTILAGDGNDTIAGSLDGRFNSIDGGAGTDTLATAKTTQSVIVTDRFLYGGTTTIEHSGLEVLRLSDGNDQVLSGDWREIHLGGGNDMIVVNLTGQVKRLFDGGAGEDRLFVSSSLTVQIDLATGSLNGLPTLSEFESATGGAGDDRIGGTSGANGLAGGDGDDSLTGRDGRDELVGDRGEDSLFGGNQGDLAYGGDQRDRICGEGGNDRLFGGRGNDRLMGGTGEDTLNGDLGADLLFGGKGADVFVLSDPDHSPAGTGGDRIADFVSGTDRIDLRSFAGLSFILDAGFSGVTGEVRQQVVGSDLRIEIDGDADGSAEAVLLLSGIASIADADFIF